MDRAGRFARMPVAVVDLDKGEIVDGDFVEKRDAGAMALLGAIARVSSGRVLRSMLGTLLVAVDLGFVDLGRVRAQLAS